MSTLIVTDFSLVCIASELVHRAEVRRLTTYEIQGKRACPVAHTHAIVFVCLVGVLLCRQQQELHTHRDGLKVLYDIITERQGWLSGGRSADAHLFRSEKQIRMPKSQLTTSFAPETPAWPLSALLRTAAAVPASLPPPEQQLGRCGIVMPHLAWSCPTVQSAPLGTVTSATVKDAWLSFEAPHICNRGSHFSACKSPKTAVAICASFSSFDIRVANCISVRSKQVSQ